MNIEGARDKAGAELPAENPAAASEPIRVWRYKTGLGWFICDNIVFAHLVKPETVRQMKGIALTVLRTSLGFVVGVNDRLARGGSYRLTCAYGSG